MAKRNKDRTKPYKVLSLPTLSPIIPNSLCFDLASVSSVSSVFEKTTLVRRRSPSRHRLLRESQCHWAGPQHPIKQSPTTSTPQASNINRQNTESRLPTTNQRPSGTSHPFAAQRAACYPSATPACHLRTDSPPWLTPLPLLLLLPLPAARLLICTATRTTASWMGSTAFRIWCRM
jgi:hypothetical protein